MSFETGMVSKLQEITGLTVWANFAQEGTPTPYIIYTKDNTEYERSLDDVNSKLDGITFEFNLIVKATQQESAKSQLNRYSDLIETKLKSMWNTTVGGEYIQDVEILNRFSQYEPEIDNHREVIEVKITY